MFEKLALLKDEEGIDEILAHLEKLNGEANDRIYNLSKHAQSISKRYEETLKKLAQ
ncbi:MAG: hypothetical protein ABI707_14615 [Ferruginibacter sp.]